MATSAEAGTKRPEELPRLGRLLTVNAKPRLQRLAAEFARKHGPPTKTPGQSAATLSNTAVKLASTGGDLEVLTPRERKAAVELFWLRMEGWEPRVADVRKWLAWASLEWGTRIGITRVAMSFVRNYDPDSEATREVRDWIAPNVAAIRGPFGDFIRTHVLPGGSIAVEGVARALATGDTSLLRDAASDPRCGAVIRGSGFLLAVLAAFGRQCSSGKFQDAEVVAKELLGQLGEHGLTGARGSVSMRNAARIGMVDGIVDWARKSPSAGSADIALGIVLALVDDPRISMTRWDGIRDDTREEVEAWLTARTIENMFRVIDELKTDRQDMVRERSAFWRSYLPHIKRAYLLCAPLAVPIAKRLKERHGLLRSTEKRHCGVLMQIVGPRGDKLIVLEVNKNASALFWRPGSPGVPGFQEREYNRQAMLNVCLARKTHSARTWQDTFAQLIEAETGIRPPSRDQWHA